MGAGGGSVDGQPQGTVETVPHGGDGDVAQAPLVLSLALWLPVCAVVAWFMIRLFAGRWNDEDPPGPNPADLDPAPMDPAPDDHRVDVRDEAR